MLRFTYTACLDTWQIRPKRAINISTIGIKSKVILIYFIETHEFLICQYNSHLEITIYGVETCGGRVVPCLRDKRAIGYV